MATLNTATIALQLEKVKKNIPLWFQQDHGLYNMIKAKTDVDVVSSRNMRIPFKYTLGGSISQVSMDAGDLGVDASAAWDVMQVTPLYFIKAFSLTKAAEFATNSDAKSIENATKKMITDATTAMLTGLESLLNTDGSGTLGSVTAITGNVITVPNANNFANGQNIQVFSALGGTNRGTCQVTGVSANAHTITVNTAPTGTTAGDLLILNGAPGTAASSLFGVEYVNTAATTGTYLGASRATYPILRSNHVSGGNAPLTVGAPRLLLNSIRRTLGVDFGDDVIFQLNVDQMAAWEALATTVQRIDLTQSKRDSSVDMLAQHAPTTIAGHTAMESIYAQPGRIDALALKTWGRAELQPVDVLEFGGQSIFPQYSQTSGGLLAASIGYLVSGQQLYCDLPQGNGYIDGLTVPTGY